MVSTHILGVKGKSDVGVYDMDHKLITYIVNRANPGTGKFGIASNSDHLFHNYDTETDQCGTSHPASSIIGSTKW
ncbi:MAG: hypothetical protein KF836_08390 [Fimbriimonadaceae bacterium]|nr:hypothetical protein [Fimbriimonadaceae bacterium]